jgi:hypothetical protein
MTIKRNTSARLILGFSALLIFAVSFTTFNKPLSGPKVDKLKLLPDFKAEHLYSPSEHKNGSWVALTFDDKGRMIASDQSGFLYRIVIPPIGTDTNSVKIKENWNGLRTWTALRLQ